MYMNMYMYIYISIYIYIYVYINISIYIYQYIYIYDVDISHRVCVFDHRLINNSGHGSGVARKARQEAHSLNPPITSQLSLLG